MAVLVGLLAVAAFLGPGLITAWRLRKRAKVTPEEIDPYTNAKYRAHAISIIDGALGEIIMVRGEIPPSVYNEEIAAALKRAYERGVHVKLVCGPKVTMRADGTHPVLDLAETGLLELYYASENQQPHFVEADGSCAYLEEIHGEGAQSRKVWDIAQSNFVVPHLRDKVLDAINKGKIQGVKDIYDKQLFKVCTPSE